MKMKIRFPQFKSAKASTLLATTLLAVIVAGTLASYLVVVKNEYTQVARSQSWNKTLMLSDAGVEEALAFINKYEGTTTELYNWTNSASAAQDGWAVQGNVYFKTNTVDASLGYYVVYITNQNNAPTISTVSAVYWNLYASAVQPFVAAAGVSATPAPIVRQLLVQTKLDSLLPGSLVALSTINLKGNNIMVDSFNSRDPLHSDWQTNFTYQGSNYGYYPYLDPIGKREANAVVATDTNIINVGNAEVYGYVDTAPNGLASIKSNGSVGDTNWIGPAPSSPNNYGIQSGHARDDMNVIFPDVTLPSVSWTTLLPSASVNIGGISYQYVITNSGTYEVLSTLTAGLYVAATNVTLYLPGGIGLNSGDALTVGTNANLTVYTGDSISTSGSGQINNVNQISLALSIYGLPPGVDSAGDTVNGCTSISVSGNGVGTGYVYAPEASLQFNGGGNGVYDVVGAFIVHDIQLNGHFNFHYDEALLNRGPHRGFIPVSWKEIVHQ
jgi:hypothetical protein